MRLSTGSRYHLGCVETAVALHDLHLAVSSSSNGTTSSVGRADPAQERDAGCMSRRSGDLGKTDALELTASLWDASFYAISVSGLETKFIIIWLASACHVYLQALVSGINR